MFDLELTLCERFPNLSPFSIRKERASEVFCLVKRLNKQVKTKPSSKNSKIRKRAGDNWF